MAMILSCVHSLIVVILRQRYEKFSKTAKKEGGKVIEMIVLQKPRSIGPDSCMDVLCLADDKINHAVLVFCTLTQFALYSRNG